MTGVQTCALPILIRNHSYVNLWPEKLDLEDAVYRPVLLRLLPFVFGNLAAVFGENKIIRPVAKGLLLLCKKAAALFGENRIITPLAKALMSAGMLISRIFLVSTDGLIVFLRKTAMREKKVNEGIKTRAGRMSELAEATREATEPFFANFSFALMMTCIGILIVLGVLVFTMLR